MTWGMKRFILAAAFAACGTITPAEQVRTFAAQAWKCDASQVQTTVVTKTSVRAQGCGQEATYVEQCTGPDTTHCPWVAEGGSPTGAPTAH